MRSISVVKLEKGMELYLFGKIEEIQPDKNKTRVRVGKAWHSLSNDKTALVK